MKTLLPLLLLLAAPAFPQRARHIVDLNQVGRPQRTMARVRTARALTRGAQPKAAVVQAPAVVQTNLMDASNVVWLVTTETLPVGTEITPLLLTTDDQELWLGTITLSEPVAAGTSFALPNIRRFGDFWPSGLLTYVAVITVGGRDTQTAADFPVGASRIYDDLTNMLPRIATTSESVVNGDLILSIRGAFKTGTPYVVFDDVVAPASAITLTASEITVNLSRVPGLDLTSMWDSLLTVGQSGWSDTAIYRHTPLQPGTYNPAQ